MKHFLCNYIIFLTVAINCIASGNEKIDRQSLVTRHNVSIASADKFTPLSVGNGSFCQTVDITGMQTFPEFYSSGIPLTTMAEWGWHSFPDTVGFRQSDAFINIETNGISSAYPINLSHPASGYLRANPHQISLGMLGLRILDSQGNEVAITDIEDIDQVLNLWSGIITSRFSVDGNDIEVTTVCHPGTDQLSYRIKSPLLTKSKLSVQFRFPYAAGNFGPDPSDFNHPEKHETQIVIKDDKVVLFSRKMDSKDYYCLINCSNAVITEQVDHHHYVLSPCNSIGEIEINVRFYEEGHKTKLSSLKETIKLSQKAWERFWKSGGAVDLSGSSDLRWKELERRIVLSQYLTAIQSRQKYPPQETGLTCNSWFGKFHLEMHWWHSVHFAGWGRLQWMENTLGWYSETVEKAVQYANMQGYKGARWPKMVGPDGIDSPSNVGPLLIWQQPHPIYYAELVYRARPDSKTLLKYQNIIGETANFMASYARWDKSKGYYELGPPLISAREFSSKTYSDNKNPTFELAYWAWGLKKANEWRERLGQDRMKLWDTIAFNLAPWPVEDEMYIEQETVIVANGGHPAHLAAYGFLPESEKLDLETMRRSLRFVMEDWDWASTWGWDYPLIAMTAARLGEPEQAIDALLKDAPKNNYFLNGHNYQRPNLPLYLPGNGGLLAAIAMMCAGWDGSPGIHAPGFPADGTWNVKWEGLKPAI